MPLTNPRTILAPYCYLAGTDVSDFVEDCTFDPKIKMNGYTTSGLKTEGEATGLEDNSCKVDFVFDDAGVLWTLLWNARGTRVEIRVRDNRDAAASASNPELRGYVWIQPPPAGGKPGEIKKMSYTFKVVTQVTAVTA
jgi:hypothetical protein